MTPNGTAESLRSQFQELTEEECLGLLRSKRLGRVAYDDAGPVVLQRASQETSHEDPGQQ